MHEYFKNKKIMVVAAHPDDEILGLGGTMHKLITESKNIIKVVVLGEGITSRSDKHNTEIWKKTGDPQK